MASGSTSVLPLLIAVAVSILALSPETLLGQSGPIISEFMADNARTLADEDGRFSDWIEIHNPDSLPVNLQGWYLTDNPLLLTLWKFPDVTLPAGGYLVVYASNKNRTADPAHLHTNFELDAAGEYLALVQPDGTTLASVFSPTYPPMKEDVAYGLAQQQITSSLLAEATAKFLVPDAPAALAADWNAPGFVPGPDWQVAFAPAALGFDINQPLPLPSNLATGGSALQSTTFGSAFAALAIDGNLTTRSQTLNSDNGPFLQVNLAKESSIERIVLYNRSSGCCLSQLRDITVEILAQEGGVTNFTSVLLNPENIGYNYPDGPAVLELNLINLTGSAVVGRQVRVRRTPDPDLSGTGQQGDLDEPAVLSMGEVQVIGVALGTGLAEVNLARTGSPAPAATQSSVNGSFTPNLAIDGDLGNFTHTLGGGADNNPSWTLNLGRQAAINSITVHNRDSCCGSRLRDITVEILDSASTVVYTSALLNTENAGFSFPNGPDHLDVVPPTPVLGQFVRVRRQADLDLSGTAGQGNADEAAVLSLGEVIVLGSDLNGYRPFIRTDLKDAMLGLNASAFVRIPFQVTAPAQVKALELKLRYDDGVAVYLNGAAVASRNAPASPAWNSTATASRGLAQGVLADTVPMAALIPGLVPGPNVLALHGMNVAANDGDFLLQPELWATRVEATPNVFLVTATPGLANDTESYVDEVADTQFSVNRGFFTQSFSLEITSPTPGAQIYYTLDCSEPGPGKGQLYTGPITINKSTVVRALAVRDGWKATDIDTQTYLFLADVVTQAANGQPPQGFPVNWGANRVDYGMDPNVVSLYSSEQWQEALTQVPTMSIVTETKNLFDPGTGIYANALQHGIDWERPGSLELIDPAATPQGKFQENCGVRIRGGFSRNTQFAKHSFRVFFRQEYGTPKLRYPLFENQGTDEFDTFDLRTSQNYSWPRESDPSQGMHDTMVREVWCRETLGAMGQPYRRSRYYHLYVNGLYWGLYETDERPEASYGATYMGGSKEDYDVVKCGNHIANFVTEATDGNLVTFSNLWRMARVLAVDASNENYFKILGRNEDGSRNPSLPVMVDVDNIIDYMLEIFYSGDGDATLSAFLSNTQPNNWFGMYNRNNPDMGFRFFNSDCEHTLGAPSWRTDRTGPFGGIAGSNIGNFTYANPQYIHEDLMRNPEYRVRFGDHVQKHFFNGGALTALECTNRWWRKAVQIDKAVRAYSARWGDSVREPPYGENEWKFMVNFVATNFFPNRGPVVVQQLIADGLFPAIGAPAFNNYGGLVEPDFALSMSQTNAGGAIYYTLDGTDPRQIGGSLSVSARLYTGPVPIDGNANVRARVRVGANWSAQIEATFNTGQYFQALAITEIMYRPPDQGLVSGDEFEFLEIKNTEARPLDLSGLSFDSGITYAFPNGTRLAGGAFFLLVRNPAQFALKYPGVGIDGVYSGSLANGGETLTLSHVHGGVVQSFAFDNSVPWPTTPDGLGFSLVPINPDGALNPDRPAQWRASAQAGGSPGANDPQPNLPAVVINEILPRPVTGPEFIELFNPGPNAADISGWYLSDVAAVPKKFRIPNGTIIAAGDFAVFNASQYNPTPGLDPSFSLSSLGEEIHLYSANVAGDLTGYSQGFEFGAAALGLSFGRHVISTGEAQWPAQTGVTPFAANAAPRVGPVVIHEIHYHPAGAGDEFIEVLNASGQAVDLFEPGHPANTWRLNGVGFSFPSGTTLPAGALALVVPTDPAAFRAAHGLAATVPVYGPYTGNLQDSGERLELQRAEDSLSGLVYITVDEVRYNDRLPWPVSADGSGPSLQRTGPLVYGNDPAHWLGAAPSPGRLRDVLAPPLITSQPQSRTVLLSSDVTFSAAASGPGMLGYQWRLNGDPISGQTMPSLTLNNVQPSQAGVYDLVVFNEGGAVLSDVATLVVLVPARILRQPLGVAVDPGTTVSFTVEASSTSSIAYQWYRNQKAILGQSQPTLVLNNVQEADGGIYTVTITDAVGTVQSDPAKLVVLIDPVVVLKPLSQTVVQGGSVTLSVEVRGTLPMSYRWRKSTTTLTNMTLESLVSFYTISNFQTANAGSYSVVMTNAAFASPGVLSPTAVLTMVPDTDLDGMSDAWENLYALNPNSNDASQDADNDGLTNGQEFIAGTNPKDATSRLWLESIAVNDGVDLNFVSRSNKTYAVEFKNALELPSWTKLMDVAARPEDTPIQVRDPNPVPSRLYRLVTPRQP